MIKIRVTVETEVSAGKYCTSDCNFREEGLMAGAGYCQLFDALLGRSGSLYLKDKKCAEAERL